MSENIIEKLEKLKTEDTSLIKMRARLLDSIGNSSGTPQSLRDLMDELFQQYKIPGSQNFHNQAFYATLIGFAYNHLEEYQEAINWFESASTQFRNQGDIWNQGIALNFLGLAYLSAGKKTQAINAYERAQNILKQEIRIHEDAYEYDYRWLIAGLDVLIEDARLNPEKKKAKPTPNLRPFRKPLQAKRPWPTAHIVYGVQDFGHATGKPAFGLSDDRVGEMSIDAISFNGESHTLYNPRTGAGDQIKLNSSGNYRWLKVAGNSMNQASPIPIEPGDYALADLDQAPQFGNIVIANLHNPPTPDERAGVIKRYASKGLKSESVEQIDPIPLEYADIRGVVIAIAKPSADPIPPLSIEEEGLYETLLGMLGGNESVAAELIKHEYSLTPKTGKKNLLENAIARLKSGKQA
jgi:tetratricopeptide (TPR) repeat protein